jgi:hypothetical protein
LNHYFSETYNILLYLVFREGREEKLPHFIEDLKANNLLIVTIRKRMSKVSIPDPFSLECAISPSLFCTRAEGELEEGSIVENVKNT